MSKRRPAGSEITSPLAENLMIELMELRRNIVNSFNNHRNDDEFAIDVKRSLKNIERLEEMIRPDIFSSEIFKY